MPSKAKLVPIIFFVAYFFIGVFHVADYGVSWDEPTSRMNGLVNTKYLGELLFPILLSPEISAVPNLHDWHDKDYGVAFELSVTILERAFSLQDSREIFLYRHFFTFIFSMMGAIAVYALAAHRFKNYSYGILAALLLITSPRIFAESFYNSKDIVFMSAFAISMYTLVRFLKTPTISWAFVHAISAAYATNVRIMGIMLALGAILCLLVNCSKRTLAIDSAVKCIICFIAFYAIFVALLFPWLWHSPIENFILAFNNMAVFRWDNELLFLGRTVRSTALPWYYAPIYIGFTTPIPYQILFFVGSVSTILLVLRRGVRFWRDEDEMQDYIYFSIFFTPLAAVILLASVLYDGWRQLYFVYPSFILLATLGFRKLISWMLPSLIAVFFRTSIFAIIAFNIYWIYTWHPYQNTYFNAIAGKNWIHNFDVDYWGLSNFQALQMILDADYSSHINVWSDSFTSLDRAFLLLEPEDRSRLILSRENNNPLYIINNYRLMKDKSNGAYVDNFNKFSDITVDGEKILSIYKHFDN